MSILTLKTSVSPPIDFTIGEEHRAVSSETSLVLVSEGSTGCHESHAKCYDVKLHGYTVHQTMLKSFITN